MLSFKEKFKIDELKIRELDYWVISLRPKQVTLGSMVLSLKRDCALLSEITIAESKEMKTAFKEVYTLLHNSFKPEKINYLALMMVDNHVHFHIIPRYKKSIVFQGREYKDINWPKPPTLSETLILNDVALKALHETLRSI